MHAYTNLIAKLGTLCDHYILHCRLSREAGDLQLAEECAGRARVLHRAIDLEEIHNDPTWWLGCAELFRRLSLEMEAAGNAAAAAFHRGQAQGCALIALEVRPRC